MIEFLSECGISNDTINNLETKCNKEFLYCLYCNEYQIKEIINYFNSIGIKCIDDILINYPEIFVESLKEVKKMFYNKDIEQLVKMINDDYTIIQEL